MGKLRRGMAALLGACMLLACASAEISWPNNMTAGQQELKAYVERVNMALVQCGQREINTAFELYSGFALLGSTADPSLMSPESSELIFSLYDTSLNTLELSVSEPSLFAAMAASCIHAASPASMPLQDALAYVDTFVQRISAAPDSAFEELPDLTNGMSPRAYFAYDPDRFHDGVNWCVMTLVFPLAGAEGAFSIATPAPTDGEHVPSYEGYIEDYHPEDDWFHFEVFMTPTPEPDSPAGESW